MGFRSARENSDETTSQSSRFAPTRVDSEQTRPPRRSQSRSQFSPQDCEAMFGLDLYRDGMATQIQRLVDSQGAAQVRKWSDEGMPVDTMGKPRDMEAFRERQEERPAEVPRDIERRNAKSVQRSRGAHHEASKAGDTQVPGSVRDIISSPGQQLDTSLQQAMEERMGDNLGDVRIHTGPKAAKACQDINARAFTVGNHIAFNSGEYDPSSAEGQHVLAHELAHVRQQTGGAVSMLPQQNEGLEIDPDERLERDAEQTAERVMRGGAIGVHRMRKSEVHVQRLAKGTSEFYEGVIDAIKRESDLSDDDIARIKDEVAQEVAGTDYDGARGHDELNVKVLEKARETAAKKAEELEAVENVEDALSDPDGRTNKELAQADLEAGNNESGNINSLTDGEKTAMDVVHDYAQTEKEHPELVGKLDQLDAELSSLLSDESLRLTDAQEAEIEALQQQLAEKFGGPTAELAINYLLNHLTETTMATSLSGLFADMAGTAEASTVAAAIVMAVSIGLAMVAKALTEDYGIEDETGDDHDDTGLRN